MRSEKILHSGFTGKKEARFLQKNKTIQYLISPNI